jgi:hypothetical protein
MIGTRDVDVTAAGCRVVGPRLGMLAFSLLPVLLLLKSNLRSPSSAS